MASSAAKKAAAAQREAALAAGKQLMDTTDAENPRIGEAAHNAALSVLSAGQQAQSGATQAGATATARLNPYAQSGVDANATLSDLMRNGGDLNRTFTGQDMVNYDPGYAFRAAEGQKALDHSAAAHGAAQGGAAMKAMARYSQDYASSEFDKAFQRFQQEGTNRYNRLSGMVDRGYNAAGQQGAIDTGTARYVGDTGIAANQYAGNMESNAATQMVNNKINASAHYGDYLTQGANAQAAGIVGSGNAWQGALQGGAQAAQNGLLLSQLMKNPAVQTPAFHSPVLAPGVSPSYDGGSY